jgi:hypothetical protein
MTAAERDELVRDLECAGVCVRSNVVSMVAV